MTGAPHHLSHPRIERLPSMDAQPDRPPGIFADRIDMNDPSHIEHWHKKLDCSEETLREAVSQVGDKVADVEMHLKGSRSTANSDRVQAVLNSTGG